MSQDLQRTARRRVLAKAKATDFIERRPRDPQGFPSLRSRRTDNGVSKSRWRSLPKEHRPLAERELARLLSKYRTTYGHAPSQQKLASLIGNVVHIVRNVRTSKRLLNWMNTYWRRRSSYLYHLRAEVLGYPAPQHHPAPIIKRTGSATLHGI